MHINVECVPQLFSTTEAARIARMPQDMLRLWRSRGHLPKKDGRGLIYEAREIAEIMVRYDLSLNGIAPAKSVSIGHKSSVHVMFLALINHPRCCEVIGTEIQIESILQMHRDSSILANTFFPSDGGGEFIVRRDNHEPQLVIDISSSLDERQFKSAMVLNLYQYARNLVLEANRPLLTIEFPGNSDVEVVRALLGTS